MLTVDNGQLYRNGRPFKHVGVNAYDLFHRYDQSFDAQPFFREGFELMRDYGIKVARCIIGGPCRHHFNTFFNAQSTYLSKLLQFLNAAADNDVDVLLTFSARWAGLSDRNNERMSAWTNPSSQCRQQLTQFVTTVITQFKDHRGVGGYELGNEWNTFLDRRVIDGDAGNTSLPSATECAGQNLAPYSAPDDSLTFERYSTVLDAFVTTIKSLDTSGRLISTGNAMGLTSGQRGLYEWLPRALRENPTTVNSLCAHPYADPNLNPGNFWGRTPTAWWASCAESLKQRASADKSCCSASSE